MPWRLERAQIRKYDGFPTSVAFCQHLERPWLWHASTEKESSILRQVFLSDFSPAFAVFQLINEVTHLFICSLTVLCIHLFNKYSTNIYWTICQALFPVLCKEQRAKPRSAFKELPFSLRGRWGLINHPSAPLIWPTTF